MNLDWDFIWAAFRTWPDWAQILAFFSALALIKLAFHGVIFLLQCLIWGIPVLLLYLLKGICKAIQEILLWLWEEFIVPAFELLFDWWGERREMKKVWRECYKDEYPDFGEFTKNFYAAVGRSQKERARQERLRQESVVKTKWLVMTLNETTGALRGEVRHGVFAGRKLSALSETQLFSLLRACAQDEPQSGDLMTAYLEINIGPDWSERYAAWLETRTRKKQPDRVAQAAALLGLPADRPFTKDDLRSHYRAVLKRVHPDVGGTDALVRQVIEAETVIREAYGW